MTKRLAAACIGLALMLTAAGCSSEPSCEDRGGKTVSEFSHFQPIIVGKTIIMRPVYTQTCEMPDD